VGEPAVAAEGAAAPAAAVTEVLFWDESWFRPESDGSACVGAVLPGLRGGLAAGVRLPRIGEVAYQGLPLAGVNVPGKPMLIVPAPVSGVVVAANEELLAHPDRLASDPCGEGWIACVCTTRYEDEIDACKRRRIVLVNADPASAREQTEKLVALGCRVEQVSAPEGLLAALQDGDDRAVFLDAASLGDAGPTLAGQINGRAPAVRIVVVASPGARETAYRNQKIFYYAVEPFSDNEIADILAAVFRIRESQPPKTERQRGPSEPISSIAITNRNGHKVQLLSAPGLLWRNEGLGSQIGQRLLERMFPVVITPGEANLTPANILKTAAGCDRVMVLLAQDTGLLPGGLARNTKPEFAVEAGEPAGKVTTLAVQPDEIGRLAGLDSRTTAALADHIVWEMASY
jgi:glycine cleavage system H lipoate-binding protein